MKHVHIKTGKGEFLVIEFPQVLKELSMSRAGIQVPQKDGSCLFISGNFTPLGYIPNITEEQAKEVVESENGQFYEGIIGYRDYRNKINYPPNDGEDYMESFPFFKALQSLHSLLEANEVVFENPLGEKPIITRERIKIFGRLYEVNKNAVELDMWETERSKVWNKENTYLFNKI